MVIRRIINLPLINPLLLGTIYRLGLKNTWIKKHFYRLGVFSRDGIRIIGTLWDPVASAVYWDGIFGFEHEMSRIFANDVQKGKIVLDIGAHIGFYSPRNMVEKKSVLC